MKSVMQSMKRQCILGIFSKQELQCLCTTILELNFKIFFFFYYFNVFLFLYISVFQNPIIPFQEINKSFNPKRVNEMDMA